MQWQFGSCNNINDPYAKLCVPDFVKNINIKVFSLIPRTNETRHVKWYGSCKCKWKLDARVMVKKRQNKDKCRFECKELIDKEYVMKDLFEIQVIVNANVINYAMLDNI